MVENLKLVDVVIEMLDARLPHSSRNPLIDELVGAKPRVLVMAKADLAEEEYNRAWVAYYEKQGFKAAACDFKGKNSAGVVKAIGEGLRYQARALLERRQGRGNKDRVIRVMVTGIPNVGKSTMINLFSGRSSAETADRPGVTRGKQWVRLGNDLELLDMPGILWPNLEDEEGARKLAVTGAIGSNAYSETELALWLIAWLLEHRPGRLAARYGVTEDSLPTSADEDEEAYLGVADLSREASLLEDIGRRRGLLRKGGIIETDKAAVILIDELRAGRLGRITWDEPPGATQPKSEPI